MSQTSLPNTDIKSETDFSSNGTVELTFPCFGKLPKEIRDMIWKEACFVQRIIDISVVAVDPQKLVIDTNIEGFYCFASHSVVPPSILHASQEGRRVGLEFYTLEFGVTIKFQLKMADMTISRPAMVYINWACDVPCFLTVCSEEWEYEACLKMVNKPHCIAVGLDIWHSNDFITFASDNLEEVVLYVPPPKVKWDSFGRFNPKRRFSLKLISLDDKMEEKILAAGHSPELKDKLLGAGIDLLRFIHGYSEEDHEPLSEEQTQKPIIRPMLMQIHPTDGIRLN